MSESARLRPPQHHPVRSPVGVEVALDPEARHVADVPVRFALGVDPAAQLRQCLLGGREQGEVVEAAELACPPVGADDGLPKLPFSSASEWEEWLEDNHESGGVWIVMAKKGAGVDSVRYPEVLDSALCFGWIDGRREALDERHFLQRFTPRRPRSRWSKINCEKVERLIAEGRMRPAGLAEVERARADGRWDAAYEGQKTSTVPDDLQRELDARPRAKASFAELGRQDRFTILYRLQEAKRPETRARRLEKFVALLEAGEPIRQ
jgi:uncharacterized protein YdeI (YjbR/CyaY-like superfamily)